MGVAQPAVSRRVGLYDVEDYLGSGGMSDVYAARHVHTGQQVALKVLRSSLRDEAESVERFLREGECAARVRHPNVVEVLDVGADQGVPFLVMELLHGETLDQRISREGRLSRHVAIALVLPIFDAVESVHRAGVVHRDVKPSNILLARASDGSIVPKLVDFGVATLRERKLITGAIGPIGTPTYMSPEQARGLDPVDSKSDQYSLASMLYEVLTGREPYPGSDVDSVLNSVARGRFPRLSEHLYDAPGGLDEVLARATAFDPHDRYASVRQFAEALLPFAEKHARDAYREREVETAPTQDDSHVTLRIRTSSFEIVRSGKYRTGRDSRRQKNMMFGAVAAVALALGLMVGVAHSRDRQTAATERVQQASLVGQSSVAAHEPDAQRPLAVAPAPTRLVVSPAQAEVMLDGASLGSGVTELPRTDASRLHELRVHAPGYAPRVLLFQKAPPQLEVSLDVAR